MLTDAEVLFERFCRNLGIDFERLPEGPELTPDYVLHFQAVKVAIEVKQLEPTAADEKLLEMGSGPNAAGSIVDMTRIRNSLLKGSKQLKSLTQKRFPGMVVLYDATAGLGGYLHGDSIAVSMYGMDQLIVGAPKDPTQEPRILGTSLGGNRVTTEDQNTTLSAVAALRRHLDELSLDIFHNCHAAVPLDPDLLRHDAVNQFRFDAGVPRRDPSWVAM